MTIAEVISKISDFHPPVNPERTNDTVKYGSVDKECTGVGITCFASADVIRRAKEHGLNLVICHEPLFWNNEDTTTQYEGTVPTAQKKINLLEETGVTVWRDHDHIHGSPPQKEGKPVMDGIFKGIMEELGWSQYLVRWPNMPLMFEIPETTAGKLAHEFLEKFNLSGIRVVGDPDTPTRVVYFCEHVQGRSMGGRGGKYKEDDELIAMTEEYNVDVLVPLEIIDWTASAFIRDSAQLGRPRAILEMGHFNTEELGMRYMLKYLPRVLGDDVPLEYLQSGDSFSYITRD